jgi:hypothetical protein
MPVSRAALLADPFAFELPRKLERLESVAVIQLMLL